MTIKIWQTQVNKIYLGSTQIQKAYLGNQLIYSAWPAEFKVVLSSSTEHWHNRRIWFYYLGSGTVDWWDGTIENLTERTGTSLRTKQMKEEKEYIVTIKWNITQLKFDVYTKSVIRWLKWDIPLTSYKGMFYNCINLTHIIDNPNLSKAIEMNTMFYNCKKITNWNVVRNWDVSNVKNFSGLFYDTEFNENISHWNTANATDISSLFFRCKQFNQPVNFNTDNVTNMKNMFSDCHSFNQPINFNMAKVTDCTGMFAGCKVFNQPIHHLDFGEILNATNMFESALIFNQPIPKFPKCTNFSYMFMRTERFNQPLLNFVTNIVTDISGMFARTKAFNQPLTWWDTSNVTSFSNMFYNAEAFNQNLSHLSLSNDATYSYMFDNAEAFNQPYCSWSNFTNLDAYNIERMWLRNCVILWTTKDGVVKCRNDAVAGNSYTYKGTSYYVVRDRNDLYNRRTNRNLCTTKVTAMDSIFANTNYSPSQYEQVSQWDTSNVTNMTRIFESSKFNNDLSNWDFKNLEDASFMFRFNTVFNHESISEKQFHKVTTTLWMFQGATAFNRGLFQLLLFRNEWVLKNVSGMFYDASNYNGEGLTWWDLTGVPQTSRFYNPTNHKLEQLPKGINW